MLEEARSALSSSDSEQRWNFRERRKELLMNISGLVGALLPVFFVLALGYVAGKRHSFDAHQAAGLSELAIGFALPASLFVA